MKSSSCWISKHKSYASCQATKLSFSAHIVINSHQRRELPKELPLFVVLLRLSKENEQMKQDLINEVVQPLNIKYFRQKENAR